MELELDQRKLWEIKYSQKTNKRQQRSVPKRPNQGTMKQQREKKKQGRVRDPKITGVENIREWQMKASN